MALVCRTSLVRCNLAEVNLVWSDRQGDPAFSILAFTGRARDILLTPAQLQS